jgi:sedoheptulokinase
MATYFIGIDVGTSKICGLIYDFEGKKIQETINVENNSRITTSSEWEDIQDPQIILSNVKKILEDFIHKYSNIKGIGVTGQMHGILYVNSKGDAISPLYTWQDKRGCLMYKDGFTYDDFIKYKTGYNIYSGFGLSTHFFNFVNKKIPVNAFKICTIMDYIVMKLVSSNLPLIDCSNAAGLGMFNLKRLEFDLGALDKIGISAEILPTITDSFAIVGTFANDICVVNAIGDNQASFLGSTDEINRSILINIGTGSQISVYMEQYFEKKSNEIEIRPFPGKGYLLVGAGLCGGYSLVMLKNFFESSLKIFCHQTNIGMDFYEIINSLDKISANDSLKVKTLFRGTRINPLIRGEITNISATNFTPQNLIIGFIEGICDELFYYYNKFPGFVTKRRNNFIGSGNAIKLNPILLKALENKFDSKLKISNVNEEAAFGACISAMIGMKYIPDIFSINILHYK